MSWWPTVVRGLWQREMRSRAIFWTGGHFFGPGRSPRVTMACLQRAASLGKTSWPNLLTDKEEMAGFFV